MRTLIRNADVVFKHGVRRANVLVEGTTIVDVDASGNVAADEVIDATGLVLMPGAVDDQVHFREPGLTHKEDLYTASRACAKGGVTTFLEMPNTNPNTTSQAWLEHKLAIAAQKSLVNYGFYIGATPENVDELAHAHRTPGIKIFVGSSTGNLLVDEQEALERIFAETTLPICAHCEDEATVRRNREWLGDQLTLHDHSRIRDVEAAVIATRRCLDLAYRHNHRFHVLHVSTAAELPYIRDHRGLITGEACVHHFEFCTDDYDRLGTRIQMNPSIKSAADRDAVWQGLLDGTLRVIATDHAPHTLDEKAQPYPKSPSGLPAVENSLALLLDRVNRGMCTLEQVAHWMCEAPARVWDIVGKGRIEVGYDADLVLIDMNATHTVRDAEQETKSRWTPWDGRSLKGWPVRTIVMGRTVWSRGVFDLNGRGSEARYDHSRGGYWATEESAR
jgi:dihydroorotase